MTKDELINKIDSYAIDEEIKINLMEDVTDLDPGEDIHADYDDVVRERDEYRGKYEEIRESYKKRFMTSDDPKDDPEEIDEDEEKIIDIKEI